MRAHLKVVHLHLVRTCINRRLGFTYFLLLVVLTSTTHTFCIMTTYSKVVGFTLHL